MDIYDSACDSSFEIHQSSYVRKQLKTSRVHPTVGSPAIMQNLVANVRNTTDQNLGIVFVAPATNLKHFSVLAADLEKDTEEISQIIKKEQKKVAQLLNNNDLLKKENERLKREMSEEEQKFLADIQAIKKYAETEILFLADYAKKR